MDRQNKNDRNGFGDAMMTTAEIYNKALTLSLINVYFDTLARFSVEQVIEGFKKHLIDTKHGTFFPKPADIVRNIHFANRKLNEDGEYEINFTYMNQRNEDQNEATR